MPIITHDTKSDQLPFAPLFALAAAGFITILTEALPAGLLSQMSSGLEVSESYVGQLVTIYAIGSLLAAIPLTTLTRSWKRRHVLLTTIIGFTFVNMVTALSENYVVILVARFFAGVFAGLLWALLAGYASRMVTAHLQGRAIAIAMVGTPLALSLGVPLGTFLGNNFGWRFIFGGMSAMTFLLVFWVIAKVPNYAGESEVQQNTLLDVFKLKGVKSVLFVLFSFILAHNIFYTYISPFLAAAGLSQKIDFVLAIFGVCSLAGIWIVGVLIDKWPRVLVIASISTFALSALLLSLWGNIHELIYISVILWGLAFGGAATLFQTALVKVAGESADVAQSMLVTVWNLAIAGGGLIGGIILEIAGVKSFSWIILIILLIALSISWASQGFAKEAPFEKSLDSFVNKAIGDKKIVGTHILIAREGKIIYEKAHGHFDREANIPMTTDKIFRLASMTKPIVTMAVLRLIEKGYLNLEDPVTRWLPDFKPKLPDGSIPVISIRQLLTHTSGLTYGFFQDSTGDYHKFKVSDGMDRTIISLDENIKRLGQTTLLFKPGTQWQYSIATDVLGLVIEKVTGKKLPEAVEELVTNPLQMNETSFLLKDKHRLAIPYSDGNPAPLLMQKHHEFPFGVGKILFSPDRALDHEAFPSGGAGMIGTAKDYLKFLESIRLGKVLKNNVLLTGNQVGEIPVPGAGEGWGWSLGFSIIKNPIIAHSLQGEGTMQWGGAYGHTWWIDPKAKLTVIILTNTAIEGMAGSNFPEQVKKSIYSF